MKIQKAPGTMLAQQVPNEGQMNLNVAHCLIFQMEKLKHTGCMKVSQVIPLVQIKVRTEDGKTAGMVGFPYKPIMRLSYNLVMSYNLNKSLTKCLGFSTCRIKGLIIAPYILRILARQRSNAWKKSLGKTFYVTVTQNYKHQKLQRHLIVNNTTLQLHAYSSFHLQISKFQQNQCCGHSQTRILLARQSGELRQSCRKFRKKQTRVLYID